MLRLSTWVSVFALGLSGLVVGCDGGAGGYDDALLAEYKRALPQKDVLRPGTPGNAAAMAMAVGEPAEYPPMGIEPTQHIVRTVEDMIDILEAVTATEPTVYKSETKEFVWGPFADEDNDRDHVEGGQVLVYIKDQGEEGDHDFRYVYALGRMVDDDLSSLRPVIWGGTNVDDEELGHGSGITLWDFEANRDFVAAHNPDPEYLTEGRFVAVYGKGPAEDNPDVTHTIVAATFRNFRDREDDQAANLDHLYGRVEDGENTVDFISMELTADMFPEGSNGETEAELLSIDMAFFNEGAGRAEVSVVGGELDTSNEVSTMLGEECWDPALNRLYFDVTAITPNGDEVTAENEGAEIDCGFFALDLDTLGVPSLEAIDPAHRAALADVAENGIGN